MATPTRSYRIRFLSKLLFGSGDEQKGRGRPIPNVTTHGTNLSAAADGSTLLTALSLSKWSVLPEGA
jgi:hypothetical protein